ncbi:MAG: hypothetical protein AAFR38_03265 [Planctomycetota bacterium]
MPKLYTMHDARIADAGETVAAIDQTNPLHAEAIISDARAPLVRWSGWIGGPAARDDGTFDADFRTWTPAGREAFDAWAATLAGETWLRPHCRHVVSDVQTCLNLVRSWEDQAELPLRLLLDPAALLTASMLGQAEDHLARAIETLGSHELVPAVVLADVTLIESTDRYEPDVAPAPLGTGAIGLETWAAAVRLAGGLPDRPLVIDDEAPEEARSTARDW